MKPKDLVDVDLQPILERIESEGVKLEGKPINLKDAEMAYRKFLTLRRRYPKQIVTPNKLIDTVWHYHILDTRKYARDMKQIFGKMLHHDPHPSAFKEPGHSLTVGEETANLWQNEFAEPIIGGSPDAHCW